MGNRAAGSVAQPCPAKPDLGGRPPRKRDVAQLLGITPALLPRATASLYNLSNPPQERQANPMRPVRRTSRRPLALEPLESRRLLAGDTPLAEPLTQLEPRQSPPDHGQGLETFASAEAYAGWLVTQAVDRWDHLFGRPAWDRWWITDPIAIDVIPPIAFFDRVVMPRMAADGPVAAVESSTTNMQIAGVDEADLVETDGDTLYTVSDRRLSILEGFTDGQPRLVGQFELDDPGRIAGMYLAGDRLTILASRNAPGSSRFRGVDYSPPPPQMAMTVLDVSDPAAPVIVQRAVFDGQLVASRMVAGELRLVLNHRLEAPAPQIVAGQFETADVYAARVREQLLATMTPQVYQVDAAGNPFDLATLVEPTAIDIPVSGQVGQLTTVTSIDVAAGGGQPAATVGLFTEGTVEVFATADAMFVFDADQGMPGGGGIRPLIWEPPTTMVTQVGFATATAGSTTVSLAAQGSFAGTVLNQFAVDEADGFLRVVVENRGEGSGVVVLAAEGEQLTEVGSLTGLAPGEDLYAVRFVADRAYFVTFVRTDPLFVVDLSTPSAPTLLGELHVPGFSDHIQPLADGYLLTIGRDADPQTGMFRGLQLSIFDVRDPASPALLHRMTLAGGRGASTPITGDGWRRGDGDHLALGFFPDEGVITIPVEVTAWLAGDIVPWLPIDVVSLPRRQYLEVFSIDVAAGISRLGTIDHDAAVDRAVQIAGKLVAISADDVTLHGFSDPSVTLARVRLDGGLTTVTASLPAAGPPALPPVAALLAQAASSLPLHRSWTVSLAETVGDRTVLYAKHVSGTIHRLTNTAPIEEAGWAAFGFESVGNLDSTPVSEFTIGRLAEPDSAQGGTPDRSRRSVVSDAALAWFGLTRDADGRIRPPASFVAAPIR